MKRLRIKVGDRWYEVEVEDLSASPVEVTVDGETILVEVEGLPPAKAPPGPPALHPTPQEKVRVFQPTPLVVSEKLLRSPMPGRVLAVTVKPGQSVSPGDEVCILESMKMEQSIRVSRQGVIKAVRIKPGQSVASGDLLVELE